MKLSQFALFIEGHPQAGRHLIYNTFSRSIVEINDQCLHALYSIRDGKQPSFPETVLQKLSLQGFIVDDERDEKELYIEKYRSQCESQEELHATILTTFECPMACVYCYQKHIEDDMSMSEGMTRDVIIWLKRQIQERRPKRCFITFYGGEPLMNMKPIERISSEMRGYCGDRGIKLELSIVTSGLLLTREVAERLRHAGIRHLQITLDGDREAHDRRRLRSDGSGTFDAIMDNIRNLMDGFYITISSNVDNTNKDAVYRLIDMVASDYAGKVRRFTFGPVTDDFQVARRNHTACPMTDDEDLVALVIYAAKHGFITDLRPEHTICGMLLSSHLVIDPYGGLYTCPSFLGMEVYGVGNIKFMDYTSPNEVSGFVLEDECLECPYVPICNGGCRYNALVEQGDIQAMDCRRDTFSLTLPLLLKTHYDLRNKDVKS